MKKALFALAAVLFALTVVTCNVDTPEENGSNIVYKDGKPWGVELSIRDGNISRSMTEDIAKLYVNYYEVAFLSDGEPARRTQWRRGETGKLEVPFGDYSGVDPSAVTGTTGAAILFAGYNRTLLAVGKLSPATANITANTTSVTFELTPLVAVVKGANDSAFQITTSGLETSSYNGGDTWDGVTGVVNTGGVTADAEIPVTATTGIVVGKKIRFNGAGTEYEVTAIDPGVSITVDTAVTLSAGATIEIFTPGDFPRINLKVDDNTTLDLPMFYVSLTNPNEATFTVTGPASSVLFANAFPHSAGVILQSEKIFSSPIVTNLGKGFGLTNITLTSTGVPSDGVFTFEFDVAAITPVAKGLSKLSIDLPVKALNSTGGQVWHIYGGMINLDYDLGDTGGSILLGVEGTETSGTVTIEIDSE